MISGRCRVAEIQAIRQPDRLRSGADQIPRRLGNGNVGPLIGMQQAIAAVTIDRHRQGFIRPLDPNHRRIRARTHHRVGPHHMVVLLIDPALTRNGRRIQEGEQRRTRILHIGQRIVVQVWSACPDNPAATRAAHSVGHHRPATLPESPPPPGPDLSLRTTLPVARDPPDHRHIQVPFLANPDAPPLPCRPCATINMRSCDSESMIS